LYLHYRNSEGGGLHYYYRTKENLFNLIFEHKFKKFFQQIFEMNKDGEKTFQEKLQKMVESHFDLIRENPRLPLLIINELSRQKNQINTLREKLHTLPEQLLAELSGELKIEIAAGRIRPIGMTDLIITMISLNISLFLLMPIAEEIMPLNEDEKQKLIEHRRGEHVKTVLNNLRPDC
jgi:TetR/AcrR family transcriptional regulator